MLVLTTNLVLMNLQQQLLLLLLNSNNRDQSVNLRERKLAAATTKRPTPAVHNRLLLQWAVTQVAQAPHQEVRSQA